jgi:hypothetical protein
VRANLTSQPGACNIIGSQPGDNQPLPSQQGTTKIPGQPEDKHQIQASKLSLGAGCNHCQKGQPCVSKLQKNKKNHSQATGAIKIT